MTRPRYQDLLRHERTLCRRRRGAWPLHRGDVVPHRESQGVGDQAAAQDRRSVDREPVLGPRLGSPRRRHHSEHVRDDIHRGEHPAIRDDHDPGVVCPDPRRVRRRVRPGRDRHLRHQGHFALRPRARRCGGGERTTVEIQARGGVLPRWSHAHCGARPSQGRRGTARRAALVPGHAGTNRGLARSCLSGRCILDVHRSVLERGNRLRHQSRVGRAHLRRPGNHDHVWEPHRFGRNPLCAVSRSHGSVASGGHVPRGLQRAHLRGAGSAPLLRGLLRHPVDQGRGPRPRAGSGPAARRRLCLSLRFPAARDAPGSGGRSRFSSMSFSAFSCCP